MIDLYLLKNALRDLTRPRKLMSALFLVLAPGLMILILKAFKSAEDFDAASIYNIMSEKVIFGFVMVILAVVFCTSIVSQEVEDHTIVYLLTRPIPRFRILTVKFIPALLVTLVTVWVALLFAAITAYGHTIGKSPVLHDLKIAPVGVLAYGCVFLLLATLINKPLIFGLLYAFGWESWVPYMPGSFQKLSLMAYLKVLAPHTAEELEVVDLTQVMQQQNQDVISTHTAWIVLTCVIIAAFALAITAFSKREYVPRDAE